MSADRSVARWGRRPGPGWIAALLLVAIPLRTGAWGAPHHYISQVAVERLPEAGRTVLGQEAGLFSGQYCLYPDQPGNPEAQPYLKPGADGRVYNIRLHLPGTREENHEVIAYYVPRVVGAFRAGRLREAMRWFGALAHFLQDSTCPAHVRYGEQSLPEGTPPLNTLEFFTRFLPEHPVRSGANLHSVIDAGGVTAGALRERVGDYRPRVLGDDEARFIFHLAERHETDLTESARHLFPMLVAYLEEDGDGFAEHGVQAAARAARLTADALYTAMILGQAFSENGEIAAFPESVSLADLAPAGGTAFTWDRLNYQGRPMRNASGSFGWASSPRDLGAVPLTLNLPDGTVQAFERGWGVGAHTEYRFLLTPGAYREFRTWAGHHAEIGSQGVMEFFVLLDGEPAAASGRITGGDPAVELRVPLGEARQLTLRVTGEGPSAEIHGVWADPVLSR